MKNIKSMIYTVVIGLTLVVQLAHPVLVSANGETPPPADTLVVTTPDPTETEVLPTDIPEATSTPVPTETTADPVQPSESTSDPTLTTEEPVASTPDPAETTTPADASVVEEPTLALLEEIPNDTSLVVLDESGQTLPLVTQEAADIVATEDPIWCPAGQTPAPGQNGCTASYATMTALLSSESAYINSQNVDGTIWITSGNIADSSDIWIDGNLLANWAQYALTLQGGWSGISGDTTIGANSVFTVPIQVTLWNNNVTVNNITVDGAGNTGLTVDSGVTANAINVTINDSTFNNNDGDGAYVNGFGNNVTINNSTFSYNSNGVSVNDPGSNVTINNSTFNYNYTGAYVHGNNVTINNSTFSNSNTDGADVFYNSTINNSTFSNNGEDGVQVYGDTTISNSTFSSNVNGVNYQDSLNLTLNCDTFQNNSSTDVNLQYPNPPYNTTLTENPCSATSAAPLLATASTLPAVQIISVPPDQDSIEMFLECNQASSFLVVWPTDDRMLISCVKGGTARITRVANTALNPDLPTGFEYVAAYKIDIFQNGTAITTLPEGAFIQTMFASRHTDPKYDILVWDEKGNKWTTLEEFQKDQFGGSVIFTLDPANPQDVRKILQGTRFRDNREDTKTNFPNIFVLVIEQ